MLCPLSPHFLATPLSQTIKGSLNVFVVTVAIGYPLSLYYNITEQTDDVTMSRMAEWASPIIPTRQNDTICLSVELALTQSSSVEVILLERQVYHDAGLFSPIALVRRTGK